MSSTQQEKPAMGDAGDDSIERPRAATVHRRALMAFAGIFLILFILIAIAQGIGHPSVASGDVATIEGAPPGQGTISEEQLEHAIEIAAAAGGTKSVPKPGTEKYEQLQKAALGELLLATWIEGLAQEMDISVSEKEVEEELKKVKSQAFKTEKRYQEFLKESHYTQEDVNQRLRVQILQTKIQEQLKNEAPVPSSREISDYYDAAKSTQYTTPESREIRIVVNSDRSRVEEAKAQLEKDDSVKSWEEVAKKYSTDPATKGQGGLQSGVAEGQLVEPLNAAVFEAERGDLGGPVKESRGYVVFEVSTITEAKTSSLEEVKSQISTQLSEQISQREFERLGRNFKSTWMSRTFCADGFEIEQCANYTSEAHPPEADPACYEADPKKAPAACPAPVAQVRPAQPGSVSLLEPQGKKLAQRPQPASASEEEEEEEAFPEGF